MKFNSNIAPITEYLTNNYYTNSEDNPKEEQNRSFSYLKIDDCEDDNLRDIHEDISERSFPKSNNFEEIKSIHTSGRKRQNRYSSSNNKFNTESEISDNGTPRLTYERLESREDSMNSSMTRKQRYIDKFIENSKEKDSILPNLNENVNLNISSISKLEMSTPSK